MRVLKHYIGITKLYINFKGDQSLGVGEGQMPPL